MKKALGILLLLLPFILLTILMYQLGGWGDVLLVRGICIATILVVGLGWYLLTE